MIRAMPTTGPEQEDLERFVPRIALMIAGGLIVFLVTTLLYLLPVVLEPVPVGAIPDYRTERVRARLQGKIPYFLAGSFVSVALLVSMGVVPGARRR